MSLERCIQRVCKGAFVTRRCRRDAVRDGYCHQHHPETVQARRQASMDRAMEKRARDPLMVALRSLDMLRAENMRLVADNAQLQVQVKHQEEQIRALLAKETA